MLLEVEYIYIEVVGKYTVPVDVEYYYVQIPKNLILLMK